METLQFIADFVYSLTSLCPSIPCVLVMCEWTNRRVTCGSHSQIGELSSPGVCEVNSVQDIQAFHMLASIKLQYPKSCSHLHAHLHMT